MPEVLLSVQGLAVSYGGIQAVKGVDLEVSVGEKVCLIGSNGAGKTTTLKAITGLLPAAQGRVMFRGQTTSGQGAWDLVQQGLVMVPEGRGVFARMSILENLQMGAYLRRDAQVADDLERMWHMFPRLAERQHQWAGTLSGGEQQMLAMARALMSRPQLLLLDEPSMGLSPVMVDKIFEVIDQVSRQGVTLLLVEQNASRALQLADRAYVMESGVISASGLGRDLLHDPLVKAAYLGQ
jgi:branched-chain amino acid transport system ATP-binding protein